MHQLPRRLRRPSTFALTIALTLAPLATATHAASPAPARIAAELARWSQFLQTATPTDESWPQIKAGSEAELARSQRALRDGEPWLALERLAPVAINLGASDYLAHCTPAQRSDLAAFEAERTRMGTVLADGLAPVAPTEFADLHPAVVRALAEIARMQVRAFYDASLEAAQNTEPRFGLFYVGQAQAARDFVRFCREVATPADGELALESLASDIASLQHELLVAYRPPAALLLHAEFIEASSLIKEAVELDLAGLHHGALLRYLQATLQSAPLRRKPELPAELRDAAGVADRLKQIEWNFSVDGGEGSIARLFVAAAQSAASGGDGTLATATTTVVDLLPRYFAAIANLKPPPAVASAPRATVTLVRWPYT